MSVCGYIRIYLALYGVGTKGGFGLEGKKSQKTKAVCVQEEQTMAVCEMCDPL